MRYVYFWEKSSNLWVWTLYGANGRKMATSVEKHYNKDDCLTAIALVQSSAGAVVEERAEA
ncbi:MAG: DUF1508 domain-containing protein [Pseudomonadota bacterium]